MKFNFGLLSNRFRYRYFDVNRAVVNDFPAFSFVRSKRIGLRLGGGFSGVDGAGILQIFYH